MVHAAAEPGQEAGEHEREGRARRRQKVDQQRGEHEMAGCEQGVADVAVVADETALEGEEGGGGEGQDETGGGEAVFSFIDGQACGQRAGDEEVEHGLGQRSR